MYQSDIEIHPGQGWANVRLGETLAEVRAALAIHGHPYDLADDEFTIDIHAPEVTFYFDDSNPKRLMQIVFYDQKHRVFDQPVIGLSLVEAMLPFNVQGYDDTLWSLVSIEEEYQKGRPLDDSRRLRQSSIEQNLECGTLWIVSQGVGLVMLFNQVHAIAIRQQGDAPKVGCGRLNPNAMEIALNAKPVELKPQSTPQPRPQQVNLPQSRRKSPKMVLAVLAAVLIAVPAWIVYRDITAWKQAVAVTGVVVAVRPEGPFPDEFTVEYSVPDKGDYRVTIHIGYTTARELGDTVDLEYRIEQPERAMTRIQIRDEGLSISPYFLAGSIGLASLLLTMAFPNHLRLSRGRRMAHCLCIMIALQCGELFAQLPKSAMPRSEDYTTSWWRGGFPSHSSSAPWHRCVQTGYYGYIFDTTTLQFLHFGPTPTDLAMTENPSSADLKLQVVVDEITYTCRAGGKWSQHSGPRVIESGRFVQRADVTDLVFTSDAGAQLTVDARLETIAWPDRFGMVLAARPGFQPIATGQASFGRLGGGFGLDGFNHLEVAHHPDLDTEQFTLELWAFPPKDYRPSEKTQPWLLCKNQNEEFDGNFGIMIANGMPQARLNVGGGKAGAFTASATNATPLKIEQWNHLAMSYDGTQLRLFVNGQLAGERAVARTRVPGKYPMAFGRRQDNSGDGYHFRGVIDEVAYYTRALSEEEIRKRFQRPTESVAAEHQVQSWNFDSRGIASMTHPRAEWKKASMLMELRSNGKTLRASTDLVVDNSRDPSIWQDVSLALDPVSFQSVPRENALTLRASDWGTGASVPVQYDDARSWHRIELDSILPASPGRGTKEVRENPNNVMERVRIELTNPTDREQMARIVFDKTSKGFKHGFGSSVTGMSAIIRDIHGNPTGIPVQLSKNWHVNATAGEYQGLWFHGITQLRIPPSAKFELELSIVYGHWGGVASASHAQLCLIGWGSNQLWDQSALGAWGESICYEPDQVQANCTITDVRPLMVYSPKNRRWNWTPNVGGGDFFRMFDLKHVRIPHTAMKTNYLSQGPCLTQATYAGRLGDSIRHSATVSLGRTDDLVRATYRIRMDVSHATEFSRFVIFQTGADTYSYTGERKFAIGNESGLTKEWNTQWGGNTYRANAMECTGRIPWVSLHEAKAREEQSSWANRGVVIRHWDAKLGGSKVSPWIAERGVHVNGHDTSTLDLIPPPNVQQFLPGDYVEATIEHLVVPQFAEDYYGPNEGLRAALGEHHNTWRLIEREAKENDREITVSVGSVERRYPDIRIQCVKDEAKLTLTGGLGYVPITLTGLTSPYGYELVIDGNRFDQSIHGNDFWQTDYDALAGCWSQTFNVPGTTNHAQTLHFRKEE